MAEKKKDDPTAGDAGAAEVQAVFDEETDQGFRGERSDPTPLESYTVKGVIKGKPTPETDPELSAARVVQHDVGSGANGPAA